MYEWSDLDSVAVECSPFERVTITHLVGDTAHEHLDRAGWLFNRTSRLSCRHCDSKSVSELLLGSSPLNINLIAQDDDRHILEVLDSENLFQFALCLRKSGTVRTINQKNYGIHLRVVVLQNLGRQCEKSLLFIEPHTSRMITNRVSRKKVVMRRKWIK